MLLQHGKSIARKVRHELLHKAHSLRWKLLHWAFRARNILLLGRPIQIQVGGISFRLVPKGGTVANLWSGLRFERCELEFILRVLQPGMTFLDVRSNVDLFALAAARKVGDGKVYAFEPCAWTFQVLQENIRLNRLSNSLSHCSW